MKTTWTVYGQEGCVFCVKAVELLRNNGDTIVYKDIREHPNRGDFRTVPQIYRNSQHIGGYSELYEVVYGGT